MQLQLATASTHGINARETRGRGTRMWAVNPGSAAELSDLLGVRLELIFQRFPP